VNGRHTLLVVGGNGVDEWQIAARATAFEWTVDLTAPEVTLTVRRPLPARGVPVLLDLTCSEPVTGLTPGSFVLRNATVQNLTPASGAAYSLELVPVDLENGAAMIELPAGAVTDLAGNPCHASETVALLDLAAGWNPISLPVEPLDAVAATILAAGDGTPAAGRIDSGAVWHWRGDRYDTVTDLEALEGYWVYLSQPAVLAVAGLVPTGAAARLSLSRGWHCLGPAGEKVLPLAPGVEAWCWQYREGVYGAAVRLLPGIGAWLYVREPVTVDFGR